MLSGHQPISILDLLEVDSIHGSREEPNTDVAEAVGRTYFVATAMRQKTWGTKKPLTKKRSTSSRHWSSPVRKAYNSNKRNLMPSCVDSTEFTTTWSGNATLGLKSLGHRSYATSFPRGVMEPNTSSTPGRTCPQQPWCFGPSLSQSSRRQGQCTRTFTTWWREPP